MRARYSRRNVWHAGVVTSKLVPTGRAAEAIGVDPSTLTRWVAAGQVTPAGKTAGGHYRWDVDDLRKQLAGNPDLAEATTPDGQ
jgi:hypothetical protein